MIKKKFKNVVSMLAPLACIYATSAQAELGNLNFGGNEAEIEDDDILAFFISIGAPVVAVAFAAACIIALYLTIKHTWANIVEYRSGSTKIDSMASALSPLLIEGALTVVTFGVTVWVTSNYTNWLSF